MPTDILPVMKRARNFTSLSTPAGWDQLIAALDARLAEIDPDYEILQAKVKFSQLRFYTKNDVPDERAEDWNTAILEAEAASLETCMVCGKPGTLHGVFILCAEHKNNYQG